MEYDNTNQIRLNLGLITAVVLLGIIAGWQTWQINDLKTQEASVLNSIVPEDLALIDHYDCAELKNFQGQINMYGDNGNLSNTLMNEVQKNLNDKC